MFFGAYAQINLLSNSITFRSSSTAANSTTHYGDLHLDGGSGGSSWGWLYTNAVNCNGMASFYGEITAYSNLNIHGNLNVNGTKNFIQPHPTDSTKVIKYIAIESGEALTIARGTAKTTNGAVTINLPEHFALVTSDKAPITVLITPEKAPALLYTKEKSRTSLTIAMKPADFYDFGDVDFSYQVTGVRDGFEDEPVIINEEDLNKAPVIAENNQVKKRIEARSKARMQLNEKEMSKAKELKKN